MSAKNIPKLVILFFKGGGVHTLFTPSLTPPLLIVESSFWGGAFRGVVYLVKWLSTHNLDSVPFLVNSAFGKLIFTYKKLL